jgi:hypothetical protein
VVTDREEMKKMVQIGTATVAVLMLGVLAGCSGGSDTEDHDAAGSKPTLAPAVAAFRATCEKVATTTRDVDLVLSHDELAAVYEELASISADADDKTAQALSGVVEAMDEVQRTAGPMRTQKRRHHALKVFQAFYDARGEFGDQCTAAGSSALD